MKVLSFIVSKCAILPPTLNFFMLQTSKKSKKSKKLTGFGFGPLRASVCYTLHTIKDRILKFDMWN